MAKKSTAKRLLAAVCMMLAAAGAWAMPTKNELAQAQQLVQDLTAEDLRAMKAGTKQPGEVAAAQLALADEAETEAGKYLLLQGAFKLYARAPDYDAAADVLERIRRDISDLPPELVVEMVNGEMRRVAAEKAPRVLAIFRDAQRIVKCRKELKVAEAAAEAKPRDKAIQRRLAECHAGLGDWPKALEIFAKIGDEAAKYELDPDSAKDFTLLKAANYWWEYPSKDSEPFKAHAAALYKKGLDDGSISGLRKTLAEKRVKEMEGVLAASSADLRGNGAPVASSKVPFNALYCVIDLSAGSTASRYPVRWLDKLPHDGFITDECRTSRLLLRRIPAGRDPLGRYSISSDFFIGVFEVTKCQWELVMGGKGMTQEDDPKHPVVNISWQDIRGPASGKDYDGIYHVGPDSFAGRLAQKTGLKGLDLPLAAQWEYACRAGNDRDPQSNPNEWGLYNMTDRFWERCLDFYPKLSGTDPAGRVDGYRCENCAGATKRAGTNHCNPFPDRSFRICMSADQDASSGRAVSRGSGTPAASAKAPDARATRPMNIGLAGGLDLELLPCPAGTYKMGADPNGQWKSHRVTISRSFWMAKYPVTYAQAKAITGKTCTEKNKWGVPPFPWDALGGDKTPAGMSPRQALDLVAAMNKKYVSLLPRGYVFRFPTEAEWEYALKEGKDRFWDRAQAQRRNVTIEERFEAMKKANLKVKDFDKYPWVLPCVAVGTKEANEWGFCDLFGNGWAYLLDSVKGYYPNGLLDIDADILADLYKDGDVDPVLYYGESDRRIVMRGLGWGKGKFRGKVYLKALFSNADVFHPDANVRLVVGPDLLKERGIK